MRIKSGVSQWAHNFSHKVHIKAEKFGRTVTVAEGKSHLGVAGKFYRLCRRISDWVVRHTAPHNRAADAARVAATHEEVAVTLGKFKKAPEREAADFPEGINKKLIAQLGNPKEGMDFSSGHVAEQFRTDFMRSTLRLYSVTEEGQPQKVFDGEELKTNTMLGRKNHWLTLQMKIRKW